MLGTTMPQLMIKRLRIGRMWCRGCGCDVSDQVRAAILQLAREINAKQGAIGGRARAAVLSPARRRAIARKAARTRWAKR